MKYNFSKASFLSFYRYCLFKILIISRSDIRFFYSKQPLVEPVVVITFQFYYEQIILQDNSPTKLYLSNLMFCPIVKCANGFAVDDEIKNSFPVSVFAYGKLLSAALFPVTIFQRTLRFSSLCLVR